MGDASHNSGGLFIAPVCVPADDEPHSVLLFSIKLGLELAGDASATSDDENSTANQTHTPQVAVLLVSHDTLLHKALCDSPSDGVLRFTVPAMQPSVLTAYVGLCDEHGKVVKVVDTGRLLVLAPDAAAEVQRLFSTTTGKVQQLLQYRLATNSTTAASSSRTTASQTQQPQQQRPTARLQSSIGSLFTRLGARRQPQQQQEEGAAGHVAQPQPEQQRQRQEDEAVSAAQPPDAGTLYVYEHFFVPFLRLWAAVFPNPQVAQQSMQPSSTVQGQIMQLLSLLLEHELWACSLLVLGRHPNCAALVQQAGLRSSDDEASNPVLLNRLHRVMESGNSSSGAQQLQQASAQQAHASWSNAFCQPQQQPRQQQQQQPFFGYAQQPQQQFFSGYPHQQLQSVDAAVLQYQQMLLLQQQQVMQQAASLLHSSAMTMQPPQQQAHHAAAAGPAGTSSPAGSDGSVESASEILVRLGLLQQVRGEQEALEQELEDMMQADQRQHHHTMQQDEQQAPAAATRMLLVDSGAWSVPLSTVHVPGAHRRTVVTAPVNVVQPPEPMQLGGSSTSSCLAMEVATPPATPAGVQGSAGAHANVPGTAASAGAPAAAALSAVSGSTLQVPAEATGLRQRVAARSLFSQQHKLSWEEEQPEPLPRPPPLRGPAGEAAAEGWYPASWQLPEPSSSLLMMHGEAACAASVPPPPPMGPVAGGQVCGLGVGLPLVNDDDPYTEPSYADGLVCSSQELGPLPPWAAADGFPAAPLPLQQQQQQQLQQPSLPQQQPSEPMEQAQRAADAPSNKDVSGSSSINNTTQPANGLQAAWQQDMEGEEVYCSSSNISKQARKCSTGMELEWADCSSAGKQGNASCSSHHICSSISTSNTSGSSNVLLQPPTPVLAGPARPWQLACLCARGFSDPNVEASYLVFKNHGCSLLDATAGFICTSMLLTSTLRSFKLTAANSVWCQLLTLVVYSLCFFAPYICMKLRLQLFLRWREPLLVLGRNTGAVVLAVMAMGYLPMVQVWKNVVVSTLSLQIQNGCILPACQQVRPLAALQIALVHVPADAIWLAVGRPFGEALVHSLLMQASALLITLMFDAWCRLRFLQRYSGAVTTGQRPPPAALPQQQQHS